MTDPYATPPAGTFTADPLVTPPGEGFPGWFRRLVEVGRRSWRSILAVSLLSYGIPLAVLGSLTRTAGSRVVVTTGDAVRVNGSRMGPFIVIVLLLVIVAGYLFGVGQAGVVYCVTREAAGHRVPLGEALRYGARQGLRLWGWSLLYGLMVTAGLCACLLPGLYLALAGCLYVPIALYQPGFNPISFSFTMVNRGFVPALGRMALVLGALWVVDFVVSLPAAVLGTGSTAGQAVSAIGDLVVSPLGAAVTVATVLLYAELRARTRPTGTPELVAAL